MKALKIALLAALTATGLALPAVRAADEGAPAPERRQRAQSPDAFVERIDKAVGGLTDDQKTKIKDIVAANHEKMKAASDRQERMEAMKAQREQIRAVLTADQQAKFDAMPQGPRGGRKAGKKKAEQE